MLLRSLEEFFLLFFFCRCTTVRFAQNPSTVFAWTRNQSVWRRGAVTTAAAAQSVATKTRFVLMNSLGRPACPVDFLFNYTPIAPGRADTENPPIRSRDCRSYIFIPVPYQTENGTFHNGGCGGKFANCKEKLFSCFLFTTEILHYDYNVQEIWRMVSYDQFDFQFLARWITAGFSGTKVGFVYDTNGSNLR